MRVYNCRIEYEQPGFGYLSATQKMEKASHYLETGECKKVLEVFSVEFVSEVDRG